MKKINLLFVLFAIVSLNAQVTTGLMTFDTGYSGEVVIDATNVTVSLNGPSNLWLGMGFDVDSMTSGGDVITHDSTGFNDRQFLGVGVPPTLDTQDWTVVSNNVNGGVRSLVVTRPLAGSDATDFTFDATATSLTFVWAHGDNTDVLSYHGGNNKDDMVVPLIPLLGLEDQTLANSLSIFPVPASDLITISIDNFSDENASLEIYSMIGQLVQTNTISHKSTIVDISELSAGIYMLNVSSERAVARVKIVKN